MDSGKTNGARRARTRAGAVTAAAVLAWLLAAAVAQANVSGTDISINSAPLNGTVRTVTAGSSATYYVTFTTPNALGNGDWITLDASSLATGLQFPDHQFNGSNYAINDDTANQGYGVADGFSPTNGNQTVSIPLGGASIGAGDQVTVSVSGVTSPTLATPPLDALQVSTDHDMTAVSTPGFSVTADAPDAVDVNDGSGQAAALGASFARKLSVLVLDQYGNPIAGEHVTFTAPAGGASGTFASSGTNTESGDVTDAAGVATSSAFTANDTAGHFQVSAADADHPSLTAAELSLRTLPGAAASIAVAAAPATVPADGVSTTTITATVTDAHGNGVAGEDVGLATSDAFESLGPVTDHGDGTYTATLIAGTDPAPAVITASDPGLSSAHTTVTQTALAPSAATGPAGGLSTTAATLNGLVNPHGTATTVHFEYGPSTGYGWSTPGQSAGSGTQDQAVTAALSGLQPATTYHYRLVAVSSAGTANGPDMTFTTATPPPSSSGSSSSSTTTPSVTVHKAVRRVRRSCHTVRRHGHRVRVCVKPRHRSKHRSKHARKGRRR